MTELKTLKDIDLCYSCKGYDFETSSPECCNRKELKQEAIKWVKFYEKRGETSYYPVDLFNWIKHFFNITEEDVK